MVGGALLPRAPIGGLSGPTGMSGLPSNFPRVAPIAAIGAPRGAGGLSANLQNLLSNDPDCGNLMLPSSVINARTNHAKGVIRATQTSFGM